MRLWKENKHFQSFSGFFLQLLFLLFYYAWPILNYDSESHNVSINFNFLVQCCCFFFNIRELSKRYKEKAGILIISGKIQLWSNNYTSWFQNQYKNFFFKFIPWFFCEAITYLYSWHLNLSLSFLVATVKMETWSTHIVFVNQKKYYLCSLGIKIYF